MPQAIHQRLDRIDDKLDRIIDKLSEMSQRISALESTDAGQATTAEQFWTTHWADLNQVVNRLDLDLRETAKAIERLRGRASVFGGLAGILAGALSQIVQGMKS